MYDSWSQSRANRGTGNSGRRYSESKDNEIRVRAHVRRYLGGEKYPNGRR